MPLYGSVKPIYLYPGQQFVLFDGTAKPCRWRQVGCLRASAELRRTPIPDGLHPRSSRMPPRPRSRSRRRTMTWMGTIRLSKPSRRSRATTMTWALFRFYRLDLSAYSAGLMPKAIVQR